MASVLRNPRTPGVLFALVLILTVLVYWPGLRGPFVFDDQVNILNQPGLQISSLSLEQIDRAARARDGLSLQRAVSMLSFALNYYSSGFSPLAFKITNLIIHLLNGVAIAFFTYLLLRLYQQVRDTSTYTTHALKWISIAVAGLWLVHPLNLTTVLYVVQRMTGLASLFTFLGLIVYLVGRDYALKGNRSGIAWIAGSCLVFTPLAVLSKENGILLPAFIILVEFAFLRLAASPGIERTFRLFWYAAILVPVLAALGYGLWKAGAWLELDVYAQREFTLRERLLTEARVIWFYLRLILLPDIRDMGLYHDDIPISKDWLEPVATLPSVVGIAILAVGGLLTLRRWPLIGFIPLWFLLGHSMESTIVPLEIAHDHRNHLPMYSVLLGLVWHLSLPWKQVSQQPAIRYGLISVFLLGLSAATYARSTFWQDNWSLATQDAINHPKSARAHTSVAIALHQNRLDGSAHRHFERAAELNPRDTTTIIRLVHHLYLTTRQVPERWMVELEDRVMRYPATTSVLWVYEPLVRASRPDRRLQDRFMSLYERLGNRPDLGFPPIWKSKIQYVLAIEYHERKDYRTTLSRLERAWELHPNPLHLLLAAEIYLKQRNMGKVREMTDPLMAGRDNLPPELRQRLDALRSQLKQH